MGLIRIIDQIKTSQSKPNHPTEEVVQNGISSSIYHLYPQGALPPRVGEAGPRKGASCAAGGGARRMGRWGLKFAERRRRLEHGRYPLRSE